MFKKKGAGIGGLLKSIQAGSKETKKADTLNDMMSLKSSSPGKKDTDKVGELTELMGSLLRKQQVKFAEGTQTGTSALGEEVRRALSGNCKAEDKTKFDFNWEEGTKKFAERVFACSSRQYFLARQELTRGKK